MKRISPIIISFLAFLPSTILLAQNVGINNTGAAAHASAMLDVSSTNKGMLAPRMTTALRTTIASPAKGLLVYDTDINSLFHFNGTSWVNLSSGGGFSLPFVASENLNTDVFKISNSGSGAAISATTTNEFGFALAGISNSAYGYGVYGYAGASDAVAVYGFAGNATAVRGHSTGGLGLDARSTNNSAIKASIILGANANPTILATHAGVGIGVDASSNTGTAIRGTTNASSGGFAGVLGENNNATAGNGVLGIAHAANGVGVSGSSNNGTGVLGYSNVKYGVSGSTISGTALYGFSSSGYGLEVAGKVKISGGNTNPASGAVLTSVDASGNAVWKANRVGFSIQGANSGYESIPNGSWRRVQFAVNSGYYDLTNSFNVLIGTPTDQSSSFTAPVSGVYHFDAGARVSIFKLLDAPIVTGGDLMFKKNSNGTVSDILWAGTGQIYNDDNISSIDFQFSRDVWLNAGERVYLEVRQYNQDAISLLLGGTTDTYFNGHLVIPQ